MNTKYVPAIIMLLGGLVRCIVGVYDNDDFTLQYALSLLLVLFIFYIIGLIAKAILDKHIPPVDEQAQEEEEETQEEEKELEDISDTDEVDENTTDSFEE